MSRLEEIKDNYAKSKQYHNWTDFINDEAHWMVEKHMDKVCEIYAKECSQASLEKASVLPFMDVKDFNGVIQYQTSKFKSFTHDVTINKESITNPENIVIL